MSNFISVSISKDGSRKALICVDRIESVYDTEDGRVCIELIPIVADQRTLTNRFHCATSVSDIYAQFAEFNELERFGS